MRSLLEVMKTLVHITFVECRDGCLWYDAWCADDVSMRVDWTLRFRIPLEDVAGGTFPAEEHEECRFYQRWIRKELLLLTEEQAMVAKAKEDWQP